MCVCGKMYLYINTRTVVENFLVREKKEYEETNQGGRKKREKVIYKDKFTFIEPYIGKTKKRNGYIRIYL